MKNLLVVLLLMGPLTLFSQTVSRCNTVEYLKALEESDPDFALRRSRSEAAAHEWISTQYDNRQRTVVSIPVVFHLLYNDSTQYLDNSVIQSQLDVINEDYRRNNPDSGQTPLAFRAVAADCEIEFCLAKRTPSGQATNGIIYKNTSVASFSNFDEPKFTASGGDDAWDHNSYLNVWVAAFANPNFLGIGTFPNSVPAAYDGIVVNYKAFGRTGSHLMPHYNKGRSLSHEIGHWLSLVHTWGDDGGSCNADDSVSDTPLQASETYGCPSYPKTDLCSASFPGIMFMNFMDYTDDECMNLFTEGQKAKMLAALNIDRASILMSNGCIPVGIDENELKSFITVFPNPAADLITIKNSLCTILKAEVLNTIGEMVLVIQHGIQNQQSGISVDISGLPTGIYFLRLQTDRGEMVLKIARR